MKYELNDAIPILGDLLRQGKLNIFVGSGISIDSGIPDWNGLITEFVDMAEKLELLYPQDRAEINQIVKDVKKRIKDNRFDAIQIATVLKNRLKKSKEIHIPRSLAYKTYHTWLSSIFKKEPNEKHIDIVNTDYPFILTSNYDSLLQDAAYDEHFFDLAKNTFSFKDQTQILRNINDNISSIIHVHGMYNSLQIDELVFTKEDYNKLILKKYEGFSFALRMLFTRQSTLFVGYGASDPHLEEVIEELSEYFLLEDEYFSLPKSFLVTKREKADSILEQYKERVGTDLIIIDNFEQYNILLKKLREIKPRKK
ncbi:SIR2 family protein [Lutibacter sp.]